ncbi:MAG: hypothetical protein ACI9WR_001423, partial [Paracoccaceae bacterium]
SGKEQSMLIKEHNKFVPNYTKIGFRKTKISSDTTGKMVWATAISCFCLRD